MMKERSTWGERGQVLVQVALGLVVLLLVVGLAIDGGNAYAERRAMQNAADAGALAGARAICEGLDADAARGWAEDYAQRNGADLELTDVVVDMGGGTVNVTARTEAATFLMGLAGFDTVDVAAEAAAICEPAGKGVGALWPIAFDYGTYTDTIQCDQPFLIWYDAPEDSDNDICELCDCSDLHDVLADEGYNVPFGSKGLPPGSRGWLRLGAPPEPVPGYPGDSCGEPAVGFWIENLYPGSDEIVPGRCIAAKEGVQNATLQAAEEFRKNNDPPYVNVILHDANDTSCSADEAVGGCTAGGYSYLRIQDFGCLEVVKVYGSGQGLKQLTLPDNPDYEGNEKCPIKNDKAILAIKQCPCDFSSSASAGGGGSGGPYGVSLIK